MRFLFQYRLGEFFQPFNLTFGALCIAHFEAEDNTRRIQSFAVSIKLSLISAIVPAVVGVILAYVIRTSGNRALVRFTTTVSVIHL